MVSEVTCLRAVMRDARFLMRLVFDAHCVQMQSSPPRDSGTVPANFVFHNASTVTVPQSLLILRGPVLRPLVAG